MGLNLLNMYQVGDTPIHLHQTDWHGLERESRGKPAEFLHSSRVSLPSFQAKAGQMSITMVLFADHTRTKEELVQLLYNEQRQGVIDFIAFELRDCCPDMNRCCPMCSSVIECGVTWWETRGMISKLEITSRNRIAYTVKMEVFLLPEWRPLNRVLRTWTQGNKRLAVPEVAVTLTDPYTIDLYPQCAELHLSKGCYKWVKQRPSNWEDVFTPEYQQAVLMDNTLDYLPALGYATDWSTSADVHYILVDYGDYSATTLPLYVFDQLDAVQENAGRKIIRIEQERQDHETISEEIEIDVDVLDTLTTLQSTDKVVFGEFGPDAPGYILRGTTKVANIGSAITRTGMTNIEALQPGFNQVKVNPFGARWFMAHQFRRLA